MTIYINDHATEFPDKGISIKEILEIKNFPTGGTAVALNNKIIRRDRWESVILKDSDRLTVISAAFGG